MYSTELQQLTCMSNYVMYHHLSSWTRIRQFLSLSPTICSRSEPLVMSGKGCWEAGCWFCHPTSDVKVQKKHKQSLTAIRLAWLASSFLHPPPDFWEKGRHSLYSDSQSDACNTVQKSLAAVHFAFLSPSLGYLCGSFSFNWITQIFYFFKTWSQKGGRTKSKCNIMFFKRDKHHCEQSTTQENTDSTVITIWITMTVRPTAKWQYYVNHTSASYELRSSYFIFDMITHSSCCQTETTIPLVITYLNQTMYTELRQLYNNCYYYIRLMTFFPEQPG